MSAQNEEIIKFLDDTARERKDYIIEKAPETVQQLLSYWFAVDLIFLCVSGVVLIVSFVALVTCVYKGYESNSDKLFPLVIISFGTSVISLMIVCATTIELLKITLAPNVFIIDWLK